MRQGDIDHFEKRVTCTTCPNKYCLDCQPNGCTCGNKEYYMSHGSDPSYTKKILPEGSTGEAIDPRSLTIDDQTLTPGQRINIRRDDTNVRERINELGSLNEENLRTARNMLMENTSFTAGYAQAEIPISIPTAWQDPAQQIGDDFRML